MRVTSQIYANDKSFGAYIKYLALKKHFTTDSYDYKKYNGKVRASFETFGARNDTLFFHKLAKREDYENLILANMIVKPDIWVRDILEEEGEARYIEWKKKVDSLSYVFKNDLSSLLDDYKENFISYDGQHPYIMTMYLQKKISLETFTILAHISKIFTYWDEKIVDKIVARDIIRLARKYKPFLVIDEKKFKNIVRERFL
jgi:hypothetical protein